MEILFTPWRYAYLTSPKPDQAPACIFCVAASLEKTRETLTLYRSPSALVMMNRSRSVVLNRLWR